MRRLQTVVLAAGLAMAAAAGASDKCAPYVESADRIVMARDMGMEEREVIARADAEVATEQEKKYYREAIAAIFKDQNMFEKGARKMMQESCIKTFGG